MLAFEPQRLIFELVCANIALNGLINVRAYRGAVGRGMATAMVPPVDYTSAENFGGVSLIKLRAGEEVQLWKLDSLPLPALRMLKLDVEDMELEVLAGVSQTIGKFHPIL